MANDVKWIKMMVGMFDGMSFKKIKRAKIGGESYRDKLTAVWFELMDFAGKCNHDGAFISPSEIPFTELSDIATMIDRDEEELELCLAFFINEGMVTVVDDVYSLSNWTKYQNREGLEAIREQTRKRVAKHREKLKLSEPESVCNVTGNVTVTQCNATDIDKESRIKKENTSPISPSKGDVTVDKPDLMQERFEQFWKLYPKKVGKGDARKKFLKLKPNQKLFDQILSAVEAAKKTEQWTKNNGRFVPNPATWLNQSRWEDDYSGSMATNSANLDYGEENEYMPF